MIIISNIIFCYIIIAVLVTLMIYFDMQRDPRINSSILIAGFCGIIWPYILYMEFIYK